MKRILAFLLTALMVFSLVSCGATAKAEATVEKMFDALKKADLEEAKKYVELDDSLEADEELQLFVKNLFGKLEYEIVSAKEVDKDTVNVVTKVTAVDLQPIMTSVIGEIMEIAFSGTEMSDEEMNKKTEELIIEAASKEDVAMVTTEVTLVVENKDGNWIVVSDEAFANALLGNIEESLDGLVGEEE